MAWRRIGLVVAILVVSSSQEEGNPTFRLPTSVVPQHYDIVIEPDFKDNSFTGKVDITIIVVEQQAESITLHFRNLALSEIKVKDGIVSSSSNNEDQQTVTLNLATPLSPGTYTTLSISFEGPLNTHGRNFFISKYTNSDEEVRNYALTNLQNRRARYLFPCFDEPSLYTSFSISIIRPNGFYSLSNTPLLRQETLDENRVKDIFEITGMMSTTQVAVAVLDFGKVPSDDVSLYAIEATDGTFKYFPTVFKTVSQGVFDLHDWNVDKLDVIVVPDEVIDKEVVESIGLVLCRKSVVAIDGARATSKQRQSMHQLVSKILASQVHWKLDFSLSSSGYWRDNAVASYHQIQILDHVQPGWRIPEQFVVENVQTAMRSDCGRTATKLASYEDSLSTPDYEVLQVKGSSLVQVLLQEFFPREPNIDRIVQLADEPILSSWDGHLGYPLITYIHDRKTQILTLTQETFRCDGMTSSDNAVWNIPYGFLLKNNGFDRTKIYTQTKNKAFFNLTDVDFVSTPFLIVDKQPTGFFRVNYDEDNWGLITNFLKSSEFSKLEPIYRAQIIDDVFNLAKSGYLDYPTALELGGYISQEEDFIPLNSFIRATTELKFLLTDSDAHHKFLNYVLQTAALNLHTEVGSNVRGPSDTHLAKLNRLQVLNWLCDFGYGPCQEDMFRELNSMTIVHQDIEEAVYCGGMRRGTLGNFVYLANQFQNYPHKKWILTGLGCTDSSDILRIHYLPVVLGQSSILKLTSAEDRIRAFTAIYEGSSTGAEVSLDFLVNSKQEFLRMYNYAQLTTMIEGLSKRLFTSTHLETITQLYDNLESDSAANLEDAFEAANSNIKLNINWRAQNLDIINEWLSAYEISTIEPPTTQSDEVTTTLDQLTTVSNEPTTASDGATTISNEHTTASDAPSTVSDEHSTLSNELTTVSNEPTTVSDEQTTVSVKPTTVTGELATISNELTTVPGEHTTASKEITTLTDQPTTVSDERTTVSKEPTTVSEESTTVSDKLTTVPNEATTISNQPTTVSRELTTASDEATTVSYEPTTVSGVHTTVSDELTTVSDEPTTASEETTAVSDESTTVSNEHTTVSNEPTTVSNELTTVSEEPTTISEEPTTVPDEPVTVSDEPTTVSNEPTTVSEESTTTSVEPTTVPDKYTTVSDEPITVSNGHTTVSEEPTTASDVPTTVSDEPTTVSDENTTVSDETTTASEKPTTVSYEPTTESYEPTIVSSEPTTVSDEPTTVSDEPTTVSDGPTSASDEFTTVSDEPTTVSNVPISVSGIPTNVSEEPTTVAVDPTTASKESTIVTPEMTTNVVTTTTTDGPIRITFTPVPVPVTTHRPGAASLTKGSSALQFLLTTTLLIAYILS